MKQVTLHITNKKFSLFLELAKSLDFVKKIEEDATDEELNKEQILQGIKQAVKEMNLIKKGKLKAVPLNDFLNEL